MIDTAEEMQKEKAGVKKKEEELEKKVACMKNSESWGRVRILFELSSSKHRLQFTVCFTELVAAFLRTTPLAFCHSCLTRGLPKLA